jgi:glycosyltransferase involved in cell wall biosynthesis
VEDVVRRARRIVSCVLVVDDGSRDATSEAARRGGARVLRHPENRGKGAALRTAFESLLPAGFDAIATVDADGQHAPEEIPLLCRGWEEGLDLVLGCRRDHFARMCLLRRASNIVSSMWIGWIAGTTIADAQCGFRLYTRRVIETVGLPEPGFEAESAVLVRTAQSGLRVGAVPISRVIADGRATSHFRPLRDSWRIFRGVLKARAFAPGSRPALE